MSISSKQLFVSTIKEQLGGTLTVDQMTEVVDTIAEQLGNYEMERVATEVPDFETDELVKEFLSAKEIEGKSESTIEHYKYILGRIFEEIKLPIREIMVYHLRKYLANMRADGKADATIAGVRSVMCSFFGWLYREGLLPTDPSGNLSPIKVPKKIKTAFSGAELELLKEKCECSRDKALISFLSSTGCRISEVCGLNRDQVDLANRQCIVLGKGNKERTVYMDDATVMLVSRYLRSRVDKQPALFIGRGSERMTPGGLRYALKRIARRAGVPNVHPHRFRRTFATTLASRGMKIEEVSCLLGHERLDTTMKYVCVNPELVKGSYSRHAS